jgi:hypothetical protein
MCCKVVTEETQGGWVHIYDRPTVEEFYKHFSKPEGQEPVLPVLQHEYRHIPLQKKKNSRMVEKQSNFRSRISTAEIIYDITSLILLYSTLYVIHANMLIFYIYHPYDLCFE